MLATNQDLLCRLVAILVASAHVRYFLVLFLLRSYLTLEWAARRESEVAVKFDKQTMPEQRAKVPQQDNHCDCGVFMLQYVEQYLKKPLHQFSPNDARPALTVRLCCRACVVWVRFHSCVYACICELERSPTPHMGWLWSRTCMRACLIAMRTASERSTRACVAWLRCCRASQCGHRAHESVLTATLQIDLHDWFAPSVIREKRDDIRQILTTLKSELAPNEQPQPQQEEGQSADPPPDPALTGDCALQQVAPCPLADGMTDARPHTVRTRPPLFIDVCPVRPWAGDNSACMPAVLVGWSFPPRPSSEMCQYKGWPSACFFPQPIWRLLHA